MRLRIRSWWLVAPSLLSAFVGIHGDVSVASAQKSANAAAPGTSASAASGGTTGTNGTTGATGTTGANLSVDERKAQAKSHFDRGRDLYKDHALDAALAEFLASRDVYPTRPATNNAILCLNDLHRYDEALTLLETLLRDFPNLSQDEKDAAGRSMTELQSKVGRVEVRATESGAAVIVDGQARGTTPMSTPVRLSAGTHLIRVLKEGFVPFEMRATLAGEQFLVVPARMLPLAASGRLQVAEPTGAKVDVIVDDVVVGQTPWSGGLAVGKHRLVLRGQGLLGTQPAIAQVTENQTTSISLRVEDLPSQLRIDPQPVTATVLLDNAEIGEGAWQGRVRAGAHRIDATADGFLPTHADAKVPAGGTISVPLALERDLSSPMWRTVTPPAIVVEAWGFPVLGPGIGSDLSGGKQGLDVGGGGLVRAGYRFGSGLDLSLDAGFFAARQHITDRTTTLSPRGLQTTDTGIASDSLVSREFLLGLSAGFRRGGKWTYGARVGAGVLLGTLRDTRTGTFANASNNGAAYNEGPLSESHDLRSLYVMPGVHFGYSPIPSFAIEASVSALFAFALTRPEWSNEQSPNAGQCTSPVAYPKCEGQATFADQQLVGSARVLVLPGLGVHYEFR